MPFLCFNFKEHILAVSQLTDPLQIMSKSRSLFSSHRQVIEPCIMQVEGFPAATTAADFHIVT
jgi:hypothetical protein